MVTGNNNFHRFFQVTLNDVFTAQLNSTQGCFVDNISQLGTGSAAGSTGNRIEINIVTHLDISGMYGQNCFTSFKVRKLYWYATVKTAWAQERFIQCFRSVGRTKNDNAFAAVETIHLGQ